jgi:hypothetical protein
MAVPRHWRHVAFGVIGALLVVESAYFVYTAWATYQLYQWGAGDAGSLVGFVREGAGTSALLDLVLATLSAGIGVACSVGNPVARRVAALGSPLIFAWGAWVASNSVPAVQSWFAAFQGEQVALAAISGLVACVAGALGLAMLVSSSS